ncbi:MAG TPA: hypothetical protein VL025_04290, partial [Thermoanaerobaculia bacterium]|nr:hypothetical protein [Thermoanaerobaculia bacterium]
VIPSFRLADGSWIGSAGISFGGSGLPVSGLSRRPVGYYRLAADLSAVLDTVAETPGSEQLVNVMTADGGAIRGISISPPPLGRSAPVVAGGDLLVWGDNASPEFRLHAPDGTLRSLVRWTAPAIPVDGALIGRMKQAALDRSDGSEQARERIETQYAVPSPAPVVPWFGGIHLDSEGAIWLREYPVLQTDSVRFRIFQPDGQLLGQLALGPRHTVLDIGREHLLTVWQDDDDLEHVRLYRLRRDGGR